MAIACLRLFTLPPCPFLPRLSVPFLRRFMALSTSLPALREYLAIARSPVNFAVLQTQTRAEHAGYNRNGTFHAPCGSIEGGAPMPALEEAKRAAEKLTGWKRPDRDALSPLVRARKP